MSTVSIKRRKIVFKKPKPLPYLRERHLLSFLQSLDKMQSDLSLYAANSSLVEDNRFLQRIALNSKQLYYDAQRLRSEGESTLLVSEVLTFLSTAVETSGKSIALLQAADSFSEQELHLSDLKEWLKLFKSLTQPSQGDSSKQHYLRFPHRSK